MTTLRLPGGVKQGMSLSIYLDYSLAAVAEVFPATDLVGQVRAGNNEFLTQLSIVADGVVAGRFIATASATQTAHWPVGDVFFDVKRVSGGVTTTTDTVAIAVARRVTP